MGLADRDYARVQPPGHGFGSAPSRLGRSSWTSSVNAWLILLCVAVFVIDGFLPGGGPIETGRYWVLQDDVWVEHNDNPFYASRLRPDQLKLGTHMVQEQGPVQDARGKVSTQIMRGLYIYDAHGDVVGIAEGHMASPMQRALHFSTKQVIGGGQLWRLIGFQFLHADLFHLAFNMIALFFFGPLVEQYLGGKRYLAFYLLCGIAGGLLYLILNLAGYLWVDQFGFPEMPGLLFNATGTPLIGASAGVFGVLIGGAFLAPNVLVLLFFVLPMRLSTLAWVLIAISVVSIFFGAANAGGEAAHLGGALAGFGLIRHPDRLHRFFDWLGLIQRADLVGVRHGLVQDSHAVTRLIGSLPRFHVRAWGV